MCKSRMYGVKTYPFGVIKISFVLQVYLVWCSSLNFMSQGTTDDFFLTFQTPGNGDTVSGNAIVDFLAHAGMAYAVAPQQLQKFPPENVPQPGDLLGGAGALLADAFQNPLVASTIGFLATGVNDGLLLSVFSSDMSDTFVVPRAAPATAFIVKESESPNARRRQSNDVSQQCQNSKGTLLKSIFEITEPIFTPISALKSKVLRSLGAECHGPRVLRPFESAIERLRCKLGLTDDRFMPTPPCDYNKCVKPALQMSPITRDMGFSNPEDLLTGANSRGDCFADEPKFEPITFGVRIQATILDDVDCEDYRYQKMCQEALLQNRMILEEDCTSAGCKSPADDPFMACLGCDEVKYDHYGYHKGTDHIDRQTGEEFQATSQSRRVICQTGEQGGQKCRLRIDRSMQMRNVAYGRALQFIQSEQYLGDEDVDLIRR